MITSFSQAIAEPMVSKLEQCIAAAAQVSR